MEEYLANNIKAGKNPLWSQITEDLEYSKEVNFIKYESLLIMGMGGSGISGDVLKLVSNTVSKKSIIVRKAYSIPRYLLDTNPFCLFISYSGNTEETISGLDDAVKNNLDWAVISSGGELIKKAKKHRKAYIKVPSGFQPRNAFGYLAQAVCRIIDINEGTDFVRKIREATSKDLTSDVLEVVGSLVEEIQNKTCVIYGGTPMTQLVANRWKTQINENAKSRAFVGDIPEVHHNEILSWESDPDFNLENYHLIFLRDEKDEHKQVSKRFLFTKELTKDKVCSSMVPYVGDNTLEGLMYLVLLGDLTSIFLAEEMGIDTLNIDTIEELKKLLKG